MDAPFQTTRLDDATVTFARGTDAAERAAVTAFVQSGTYRNPPDAARLFSNNAKNHIYRLELPGLGCCILKEARVNPQACWTKQVGQAFRLRFRHRFLRTLRMVDAVARAGIPTFHAYACWTDEQRQPGDALAGWPLHVRRQYFLYRELPGEMFDRVWQHGQFAPEARPLVARYMEMAGQIARHLHEAGLQHRDLLPRNLIVPAELDGRGPMGLIDLDSARPMPRLPRRWRWANTLCSLVRITYNFDDEILEHFARAYCRGDDVQTRRFLQQLIDWRPHGKSLRRYQLVSLFRHSPLC